jgi:hypothetical protein
MKKVKIKMGFASLTLSLLQARKNEIEKGMTGNAGFPTTVALVKQATDAGNEFDDLMVQIKLGNRSLIPRRDVVVTNLIDLLTAIGNEVTSVANGDYQSLSSTGFGLYSDPTPAPPVSAPEGLTVSDDQISGGFKVKIQKVPSATTNAYQWTTDPITPASVWESSYVKYVECVINGLQPQKKYWVRVGAVAKDGTIAYCNPVSRTAQ